MGKTLKPFLFVFPIFFTIIFLVTWGLLSNGFFQQDEWMGIANVIRDYGLPWWSIFTPAEMHFSPLGTFFWSTLYKTLHLQAQYYFLIELIVHASVSTLVYILTVRLTKNKAIGALTGIMFLLNGRAHQAFTHLAIFHSTDTTMFFILLFFVYLSSIKKKILSLKNLMILLFIFIAAVSIREEGFILIPTFVAYLFCFDREKFNKNNTKLFFLFGVGVIVFLLGRIFAQGLHTESIPVQYQINGKRAVYNLATIPVKLVIQNLINYIRISFFFLDYNQKIYPGMIKNIFSDAAPLMDLAFFYIFSIISSISAIWLWAVKPKRIGLFLVFFSVWISSHAFMLSFVGFPIYVLEPRYLYFSAFPVFCLVSIFIYTLYVSKSKWKIVGYAKKTFVVIILIILFLTSYQDIRSAVKVQIDDGIAKKKVLDSLIKVHPLLSKNTIFFVQCHIKCYRNGELGMSVENVLPFPSGPGMNILIMYAVGHEKEWSPFFTNYFLFDTFAEDYKRIGDRSYGYFVTKSKLEKTLKKNNLSKDVVVALELDEKNYTFKDISKSFRETINLN